jgi:hypothetical protein
LRKRGHIKTRRDEVKEKEYKKEKKKERGGGIVYKT